MLKYWRKMRGYSVRELADKSGVDASTVSLLENQRRHPHGSTVRQLATTLEVEVAELYGKSVKPIELRETPQQNANETQTSMESRTSPTTTPIRRKFKSTANFWVVDFEADTYGPFNKEVAEGLKLKLGQARVYEGVDQLEVWKQHRLFLVAVANNRQNW